MFPIYIYNDVIMALIFFLFVFLTREVTAKPKDKFIIAICNRKTNLLESDISLSYSNDANGPFIHLKPVCNEVYNVIFCKPSSQVNYLIYNDNINIIPLQIF